MTCRAAPQRGHSQLCRRLTARCGGAWLLLTWLVPVSVYCGVKRPVVPRSAGVLRQHPKGVSLRAEEEREIWGGNENLLGKQRPLPPGTDRFGDSIWFDITLKKPLGIVLVNGPEGPGTGVGVGELAQQGSAIEQMKEAIREGAEPSMWVQEADELVQVDGEPCEESLDKAVNMIMAAPESVTLTFARPVKGYIKVIFPGDLAITSPRSAKFSALAAKVGYDSGCTSPDGRDPKCFYKDPATGEVYVLPLNVPGIIPSSWRQSGEGGLRPGEGEFESWMPLRLVPAPEEFSKALKDEAEALKKARKENQ